MKKLLLVATLAFSMNALADNELILPHGVLGSAAPAPGQVTIDADQSGSGKLIVKSALGRDIVVSDALYTLHSSTDQNSSGALSEQNLGNYSMPAMTLFEAGDGIKVKASGTFPAVSDTSHRIKFLFGSTTVLDTVSMSFAVGGAWHLDGHCLRVSSSVSKCGAALWTSVSSFPAVVSYAQAADSLESTVNVKVTGNSVSAGSVVGQVFEVLFKP